MISAGFKKELIVNAYKTQFTRFDMDIIVHKNSISPNIRIKNWLLFKISTESFELNYKFKNINIDYNIRWFLTYLIDPFYAIYQYSVDKKINTQEKILSHISSEIKNALDIKQNIDEDKDYVKYMVDIHD
jgi:hypothetical protein